MEEATKVVWKFNVDLLIMTGAFDVRWPRGARVLCVRQQGVSTHSGWAFWVECDKKYTNAFNPDFDPDKDLVRRVFVMVGTGDAHLITDSMVYVTTIFSDTAGTYVFHIYELQVEDI